MIDQIYDTVKDQLASNEFLAGGAVLGVAGTLFALLRHAPGRLWSWTKRRLFIDFEVTNADDAYDWLQEWLARQPYSQKRARWLSLRTMKDDEGDPRIILTPAPGTHWLMWRGRFLVVKRDRKDKQTEDSFKVRERETMTLSVLAWKRDVILEFLSEIKTISNPPDDSRISLLAPGGHYDGGWSEFTKRQPRPLESVILPEGVAEKLVDDVDQFRSRKQWYTERGIPWRRGYLLYGPPGSGKSSIVFALASHLKLNLAMLNLNSGRRTDAELQCLLGELPPNTILLIEDIDCVFEQRDAGKDKDNRVTFSGLLNAIDGVAASEGTMLFMTTNHVDKLDEALIRPGRCDVKQFIGLPDKGQVKRMFERFFGQPGDDFAQALDPAPSMAAIQGHLIKYSHSWEEAISQVTEIIPRQYQEAA